MGCGTPHSAVSMSAVSEGPSYLLALLIAEAVLRRLERAVFAVISPKFWKRYVDDTFVII